MMWVCAWLMGGARAHREFTAADATDHTVGYLPVQTGNLKN